MKKLYLMAILAGVLILHIILVPVFFNNGKAFIGDLYASAELAEIAPSENEPIILKQSHDTSLVIGPGYVIVIYNGSELIKIYDTR